MQASLHNYNQKEASFFKEASIFFNVEKKQKGAHYRKKVTKLAKTIKKLSKTVTKLAKKGATIWSKGRQGGACRSTL